MKLTNEAKVGSLILGTGILAVIFAWIIGIQNPFSQSIQYYVTYNFAGGIEVGSPVRVSGIKVGRVEKIEFFVPVDGKQVALKEPGSAETDNDHAVAPLRLTLSVRKDAAVGVRKDSRFYINLAGIIGERYIEITPGSTKLPALTSNDLVAGIDPPRIDQLISQSFNLAGKIIAVIDENKGDISRSIGTSIAGASSGGAPSGSSAGGGSGSRRRGARSSACTSPRMACCSMAVSP